MMNVEVVEWPWLNMVMKVETHVLVKKFYT